MDFIINNKKPEVITVKKLINVLLEQDMEDIIVVRDKEGIQLHNVSLLTKKPESLGCLFG